ncbi:hypothetical protein F1D05_31035 [Kribbella qitaiheensis]|uniref:DUF7577 domain-containing protein n=1 Tax=Kribbella qitaiheensis TaxID=1544730 RepID=A0A7G6X5N4_9ACTN|nr:hypothetical protein [Kribbella qitaiheensis]QNE21549.1 hypothetical protein F1D05_31035 [Kribbella qitaiheensis]
MAIIEDVCTACGERNPAGSAFCLYCGVYLGWDQATAEERPPVRQAAGEPTLIASQHPDQSRQPTSQSGQPTSHSDQALRPAPPVSEPQYEDTSGRPKAGEVACPQCGVPNAVTLRFCSKCGKTLRPSLFTSPGPTAVAGQSWWQRLWDPKDRKTRRDYRRSLPPLYRWRRVIVGVGGIAAVVVVLSVVGKNPVGWAKDRVNDVRGALVAVDPVVFAGAPPQSVAPDYNALALGTAPLDDAWATPWVPTTLAPLDGCTGKAAAKGMVTLTFKDPVRVRRLDVRAGLPAANAKRALQFRPSVLLVMYEGRCSELQVKDSSDLQQLKLDTGVPVKQLLIAVGSTYPARADAAENLTALTSITVQSRPH